MKKMNREFLQCMQLLPLPAVSPPHQAVPVLSPETIFSVFSFSRRLTVWGRDKGYKRFRKPLLINSPLHFSLVTQLAWNVGNRVHLSPVARFFCYLEQVSSALHVLFPIWGEKNPQIKQTPTSTAFTSLRGCKCIDSEVFTVITVTKLILPFENQPSRQVIYLKNPKQNETTPNP